MIYEEMKTWELEQDKQGISKEKKIKHKVKGKQMEEEQTNEK